MKETDAFLTGVFHSTPKYILSSLNVCVPVRRSASQNVIPLVFLCLWYKILFLELGSLGMSKVLSVYEICQVFQG